MPTTQDEARVIIERASEYISASRLYQLFCRLDRDVGDSTENDSVRQTMAMLKRAAAEAVLTNIAGVKVSKPMEVEGIWMRRLLHTLMLVLVIAHMLYITTLIMAFFVLPFVEPWYVAAPLVAVPVTLAVSPVLCPLTWMENRLRVYLGLPIIHGFVGHYFIKPIKLALDTPR